MFRSDDDFAELRQTIQMLLSVIENKEYYGHANVWSKTQIYLSLTTNVFLTLPFSLICYADFDIHETE